MNEETMDRHVQEAFDAFEERFPPGVASMGEFLDALERLASTVQDRIDGVKEELG